MLPTVSCCFGGPRPDSIELTPRSSPSRLSDNARAREALRQCLPEPLRDATFADVLQDDASTKRCLAQLLINLSDEVNIDHAGAQFPQGLPH
ncbi:MAG: hypothetical protein INR71_07140 [Terriglobus roseus]|nr:hypothetical protein [Terriglobus roseus]